MVKENKIEREYNEKYGDIPCENLLEFLTQKTKISKKRKNNIDELVAKLQNTKWNELEYIFYIIPKATPRPRKGRNNIFYVKGAKDNKEFFKRFCKDIDDFPMIHTPAKIQIDCYFPMPSGMNYNEKILAEMGYIRPTSKPDWDNVAKTYCDMLQDTILSDDSYIVEGLCRKFYSVKPRVEVHIQYMEDFDSMYNKFKYLKKKGAINNG